MRWSVQCLIVCVLALMTVSWAASSSGVRLLASTDDPVFLVIGLSVTVSVHQMLVLTTLTY